MSDHWNALANLLGTPSVDPLQRKTAPAPTSPPEKPVIAAREISGPSEFEKLVSAGSSSVEEAPSSAKAEPPSRIRASWDAVARLFGVSSATDSNEASSETKEVSEKAAMPSVESNEDIFSGFRGRVDRDSSGRSAGSQEEQPRAARESKQSDLDRPRRKDSVSHTDKSTKRKRPPSFWESSEAVPQEMSCDTSDLPSRPSREPSENYSRFSNEAGETAPRDLRYTSQSSSTQSESESIVEGDQPERRGRRRTIRRGRDSAGREDQVHADEAPRGRREDSEVRSAPRDDRPEREPRRRRESRSDDSRRPKSESSEARERSGRERMESSNRETVEDFVEEANEAVPSQRQPSDREGGRHRRRRGRRRSSFDEPRAESEEEFLPDESGRQVYGQHMTDDEDDLDGQKITKITSWIDAIAPMIESNMDNHKRNPSDHRGRGSGGNRGGHRRRGGGSGNRG